MASRYYGIELGAGRDSITQGSSTTSKGVEVVVDLADLDSDMAGGFGRERVVRAVQMILDFLKSSSALWPPA